VLAGDTDLYEQIVRRYQADVFRIARTLIYDQTAVDDVVQQVFLNAYMHLADVDLGRDLGPWLRTIARNAVREHLRKTSRYTRRLLAYADAFDQFNPRDGSEADSRRHLSHALKRCLEHLPERSAEAVSLRYFEGLSYDDIAAKTGSRPGALRNLLARVRTHLRACIEKDVGQDE